MKNYNRRRVAVGGYLKMKRLNYILYIKLQQISYRNPDESHRYINWELVNKTELCKELKTQPKYLYSRLKKLEEYTELINITRDEDGNIKFIKLLNESDYYVLLDLDTQMFNRMMLFTKDICWRVYLCHRAESARIKQKYGKDEYYITQEEIADRIGYSKTNRLIIQECNEFLMKEMSLITYSREKIPGTIKTVNKYKVLK